MIINNPYFAALDLGSNSFHLLIVKVDQHGIQAVDKIKHMVRLGEGLTADNYIDAASFERALTALKQMGQVIAHIPSEQIRTVGTNTLRIAKNGAQFVAEAEKALQQPIDIISGVEEARLIYIGITRHNHFHDHNLIIDVGGGSTEVIAGNGREPVILCSFRMGCANIAQRYFPRGKITKNAVKDAMAQAGQLIAANIKQLRDFNWQRVILSSGTAKNIEKIIKNNNPHAQGVTYEDLQQLLEQLIIIGKADKLPDKLGINEQRAFGFCGGVCIIAAMFEHLNIKSAFVSQEALREGVIFDLIGRDNGESDERERTVNAFQKRFSVDVEQAQRVANLACYIQKKLNNIPPRFAPLLLYSAQLHEIGLAIARQSHYQHGAYIIDHADMPGFSTLMEKIMALIVRGQRRKIPINDINALPENVRYIAWQSCLTLRLAVLLMRSRQPLARADYPEVIKRDNGCIELLFCKDFLAKNPLTCADLEEECQYWQQRDNLPYTLQISLKNNS